MIRTDLVGYLAFALVLGYPLLSVAAPKDAGKFAVTEIDQTDTDFALQGEYFGTVVTGTGALEYAGLQVVALGDGAFEAVFMRGGLPAAGWDRRTQFKLSGKSQGERLELASPAITVTVERTWAAIRNSYGNEAGRLERIKRVSPTLSLAPPDGAQVLFDGQSTEHFVNASMTTSGLLNVGALTKAPVGDFRLHLEFRTPYMPYARGQGRSNSGVYIQQRYEVQILDSFGLPGEFNECGSLYRQRAPSVNACLPPLAWQTYDINFTAARWDANKKKAANARITVLLNGERVQDNVELSGKTGAGQEEGPEPRPILLQNHGNPVHFRNVWIVST